jgi:hypothetical protein
MIGFMPNSMPQERLPEGANDRFDSRWVVS